MGRNRDQAGGGASECCMCGDYGLSSELFRCQHCLFRSQHKYCSNLYPEAESYNLCNWCLSLEKGEGSAKGDPPNSSSSHDDKDCTKMKKMKRALGNDRGGLPDIKPISNQIKKKNELRAHRPDPSSAGRKRVTTDIRGGIAKRIVRTRSHEMSNGGTIIKQVSKNKVRRYKLLDEVSS